MVASFVLLTPLGAIVMLAAAIPLAGLALAARREQQAREALRLGAPPRISKARRMAALVAVPVLLGLAATQPALTSTKRARVRTDVQAYFVLDISRSMLASRTATSPTRLARAKQDALELREAIPEVPSGIATLTDRVVPNLFPNPDLSVFADTLDEAVKIEQPPPQSSNVIATSFDAIGSLGTQNFFSPSAKRRVVVVLSDGESTGTAYGMVANQLASGHVRLVLVHVWAPGENVYDSGVPEEDYHENPQSGSIMSSLASAADGHSYSESSIGRAERAVETAVGNGPTVIQGRTTKTTTLAPYVALLALLPLLLVLPRIGRGLGSALRVFAADELQHVLAWKRHRGDYSRPRVRPARPHGT